MVNGPENDDKEFSAAEIEALKPILEAQDATLSPGVRKALKAAEADPGTDKLKALKEALEAGEGKKK